MRSNCMCFGPANEFLRMHLYGFVCVGLSSDVLSYILHLDKHMNALVVKYGMWTYAVLFAIVFAETGLVVTPFLPGDSLLFACGTLSALGTLNFGCVVADKMLRMLRRNNVYSIVIRPRVWFSWAVSLVQENLFRLRSGVSPAQQHLRLMQRRLHLARFCVRTLFDEHLPRTLFLSSYQDTFACKDRYWMTELRSQFRSGCG